MNKPIDIIREYEAKLDQIRNDFLFKMRDLDAKELVAVKEYYDQSAEESLKQMRLKIKDL